MALDSNPPRILREEPSGGGDIPPALLIRNPAAEEDSWILMGRPEGSIAVNGLPVAPGLRVLVDRDEIRVGSGEVFFFSDEDLPRVVGFPGSEDPIVCPRCQLEIKQGDPAVRCPQCRVWHHQTEGYPCWTYEKHCAADHRQPTDLDGSYQWTPEGL